MKQPAPNHPKMHALAQRLSSPLHVAVGIMEMLWKYAGSYAPRGDIGRLDDAAIARAVDWRKKTPALIEPLIEVGFLDRSELHRLIVHDWPDHAEDFVRKRLRRSREDFLPEYGQSLYEVATESGQNPDEVGHTRAGKARQGTSSKENTNFNLQDFFEKLYAAHPKKAGRILAEQALAQVVSESTDPQAVMLRIAEAHDAQMPELSRDEGRFCPQLHRWLSDHKYLDDPPSRPQTLAERIAAL